MTKAPSVSKVQTPLLIAMAVFLVVVMPALNAAGYIEDFTLNVWGKYLCYAIKAVSIDLLWGYTGLLCLGQALFFTLGGYMMGMHLMLMIGKLGSYNSDLPDFLVFLGHTKLPTIWQPFYSFPFARPPSSCSTRCPTSPICCGVCCSRRPPPTCATARGVCSSTRSRPRCRTRPRFSRKTTICRRGSDAPASKVKWQSASNRSSRRSRRSRSRRSAAAE